MSSQRQRRDSQAGYDLARQLAKLWPHRQHESFVLTSFLCYLNIHYWRSLDLRELYPGRTVHHCFWCSRVRLDGVTYDV